MSDAGSTRQPPRGAAPIRNLGGMSEPREIIGLYLADLDDPWRSTAERLIEVVLGALPGAQYECKWGQLTFTRENNWHHWICAVAPTKKAMKLIIHKGALLSDSEGVMEGKGRYTRAIPFRAQEAIDADVLAPILQEAAARQTEMWPSDPG